MKHPPKSPSTPAQVDDETSVRSISASGVWGISMARSCLLPRDATPARAIYNSGEWARRERSLLGSEHDEGALMGAGTAEEIRIGGLAIRFLIEGHASGGSIAMLEFEVAAGAKTPAAHSHDAFEETIYGLAGVLTMTVEGRKQEIGPGDVVCVPRGVVHRSDNFHSSDAKVLVIITPGGLGPDYFHEMAAVIKAAAGGPSDSAALAAVMRRHGITPAP
jgi:quercetin dioxygenase-like cupin family protein